LEAEAEGTAALEEDLVEEVLVEVVGLLEATEVQVVVALEGAV